MKCPKCNKEMETGFLQWDSTDCITWCNKLLPLGLGYWKKDAELIQSTTGIGVSAIPAHICKQCKIVLGEYGQSK